MEAGRSRDIGFRGENGGFGGAASAASPKARHNRPGAQSARNMKPSKYAASSAWPSSGSTCATYWSGRTTTMQPLLAIDAAHGKDVVAALQIGAEHLFVVAKPVTSFRAGAGAAAWPRWRARDGACWNTARTSITESISAPGGRVPPDRRLRVLARGNRTAREHASWRPRDRPPGKDENAASGRPPWRRGRDGPAWHPPARMTGAEWKRMPIAKPLARCW